uniref:Uncharacterized protein n=1 Tax=Anopheles epiroticus TaxID=199890 RepID=A0A182NZZ4_9DIPT
MSSTVGVSTARTTRRTSNAVRTLASTITTRRPQRTLIEKSNDANYGGRIPSDIQQKLINCKVVVQDILAQNSSLKELSRYGKDYRSIIQIDISAKDDVDNSAVPPENQRVASERNSYVTRRTKSRSIIEKLPQTINIVPAEQGSVIHLDESSVSTTRMENTHKTTSIDQMQKQTNSKDDVIVYASFTDKERTRRASVNVVQNRSAQKRKPESIIPSHEAGVSPPKRSPDTQQCLQASKITTTSTDGKSVILSETSKENVITTTSQRLDNVDKSAFKNLIVSIKRIAPALSAIGLKRLKYPEMEPLKDTAITERSSSSVNLLQTGDVVEKRRTLQRRKTSLAQSQIAVHSPILEVPDSPPHAQLESESMSTVPNLTERPSKTFKKPNIARLPRLPLVSEVENEDVYEFLSSSQNSDITTSGKTDRNTKQKRGRKPAEASVRKNPKASTTKAKAKAQKSTKNPFGFHPKALQKVIKKIGGGPVKQPEKADFKINLEIPKTPTVVAPSQSAATVAQSPFNLGLNLDVPPHPLEISRKLNPAEERLKPPVRSQPLFTSTPAQNKLDTIAANSSRLSSVACNPATPWRMQEEMIVPRTSYVHRTKEMLPSYESFTTEDNNNVQVGSSSAYVTERRKSAMFATGKNVAAEANMPSGTSCDEMVSDRDLLQIEQMYKELKATSEMSEKLITAMRRCKSKGATPQQRQNLRQASQKLKKWYERSMQSFNHSMRIINSIQRMNNLDTERSAACPSPRLSQEQQRTVENFNLSTDQFRSMIDDLQSALQDSDIENRPPSKHLQGGADITKHTERKEPSTTTNSLQQSKCPKDVVILPDRGTTANRNPLMPLNVVPLPQRDSPLISPLARKLPASPQKTPGPVNVRRELEYDKETNHIATQSKADAPPSTGIVEEIIDETTDNVSVPLADDAQHSQEEHMPDASKGTRDYFGFNDDDDEEKSVVENSEAQITLPNPLNISKATLRERLNRKQLVPKRPIFRTQPKQQSRSSGPTRFPAKHLRLFSSPTKRPAHTLGEFVASTPRQVGGCTATEQASGLRTPVIEPPDVSVIETNCESAERNEHDGQTNVPDVVLFDTPDQPAWLNNSAHQRTYARVPKLRKKKKNIYLANLGLDDDDDDEEEAAADSDDVQELSSDSDTEEAQRKKKNKQRKARQKRVPVEQTKDFKEFVDNFNSMCEEVERYELIVDLNVRGECSLSTG